MCNYCNKPFNEANELAFVPFFGNEMKKKTTSVDDYVAAIAIVHGEFIAHDLLQKVGTPPNCNRNLAQPNIAHPEVERNVRLTPKTDSSDEVECSYSDWVGTSMTKRSP